MPISDRALLDTAAMIYAAGLIAYSIVLSFRIAGRRAFFTARTFRIYLGSSVIMSAAALVGFWAMASHRATIFVAFVGPVVIYPLREAYLGEAGRKEVTHARISVFKLRR
jgi:hypothetical protein